LGEFYDWHESGEVFQPLSYKLKLNIGLGSLGCLLPPIILLLNIPWDQTEECGAFSLGFCAACAASGTTQPPLWLIDTGCHIRIRGKVKKYLGAPWGMGLLDPSCRTSVKTELVTASKTWSAQLLSFPGQVLLVKHVLQAIPIYHMMFIKVPQKTASKLECIFRSFLWGYKPKAAAKQHW
jgi:hypothetical protein